MVERKAQCHSDIKVAPDDSHLSLSFPFLPLSPIWNKIKGPAAPACRESVKGDVLKILPLVWAGWGGQAGGANARGARFMDFG